jgi:hypothetical protein
MFTPVPKFIPPVDQWDFSDAHPDQRGGSLGQLQMDRWREKEHDLSLREERPFGLSQGKND